MKIECYNVKFNKKNYKTFEKMDFYKLPFIKCLLEYEKNVAKIKKLAKEVSDRTDALIVIGVGGSILGTRAFTEIFGKKEVFYCGNSFDKFSIETVKEKIKGKKVAIHVVSKSGVTLETLTAFEILKVYANKNNIFITTTEDSPLYRKAELEGYTILGMDKNLGGRFSTLSNVGFFAMAYAGLNITKIYKKAVEEVRLLNFKNRDNLAFCYANARIFAEKCGKTVELLSTFHIKMAKFLPVVLQLFAESLGKSNKGLLPSVCLFSEDLHSVGQFIQEGKDCFMEAFFSIEQGASAKGEFNKMIELNSKAEEAVIEAHNKRGLPIVKIIIEKLTEETLTELLIFTQITACLCGNMMKVNFLNQEGVESYKSIMRKKLK